MNERLEGAWECIRTEPGPDLTIFRVRFDWLQNPRTAHTVKATVLESLDWVNVVALTPEEKVVVVRQFRFGTGRMTIEIPAGIVEAGEPSGEAAARELQEETGYTTSDWEYLGYVEPNPAFLDNACHHWLARNVVQTQAPQLDKGEDVLVGEMSLDEIRQEVKEGRLRHSLTLVALSHVFDLWDTSGQRRE